jgi:hypothetical protein
LQQRSKLICDYDTDPNNSSVSADDLKNGCAKYYLKSFNGECGRGSGVAAGTKRYEIALVC